MQKAASVIIKNDHNQILLMQRSEKSRNEKLKWENAGGEVDLGEEPEATVRREAKEELGVDLLDLKFLYIDEEDSEGWQVYMYEARINQDPILMEKDFCEKIEWVNLSDLKNFDLASYTRRDFERLGYITSKIHIKYLNE